MHVFPAPSASALPPGEGVDSRAIALDHQGCPSWGHTEILSLLSEVTVGNPQPLDCQQPAPIFP